MEPNEIKENKNAEKEEAEEIDTEFKDYTFKSFLIKESSLICDLTNGRLDQSKCNDLNYLKRLESYDNTNPNVISALLKLKKNNKLLFNNLDILTKDNLSEFGIIKKYSNRDTYFYFLEFIASIKITDNFEDSEEETESEKSETKVEKVKEPNLIVNFSGGNIVIEKGINDNEISLEGDKSEKDYQEMITKKNVNIDEYFKINGTMDINKLRQKIQEYKSIISFTDEHKNNFPDFESELFFHYQLINVLQSFKELNDDDFEKKINMIKSLNSFILRVKTKEIKDLIILIFFYFIVDIEYELDLVLQFLIRNYDENEKSYDGAHLNKEENRLYIDNSDIIIDNFDYYILKQSDIDKIRDGKLNLPLTQQYYSLKGYLLMREFTSKDGNYIYKKFLTSKLSGDLLSILYGEKNSLLLRTEHAITLIQNNTYLFPIKNTNYAAYTDKNCFKAFIDFSINEIVHFKHINLSDRFKHMIRKAFLIDNMIHEFGHTHKPLLSYIISQDIYFDSPKANLKLNKNKEIETKEGGKIFEYFLFDRVINKMNIKEIIYICNINNFSKGLKDYRKGFINLKNEDVKTVFQRESKNNPEILAMFEEYKKLPKKSKNKLEKIHFRAGKIKDNDGDEIDINFEDIYFESGKRNKSHDKFRKDSD